MTGGRLLILAAVAAALLVACGTSEEAGTPSPSGAAPTSNVTASPTVRPAGPAAARPDAPATERAWAEQVCTLVLRLQNAAGSRVSDTAPFEDRRDDAIRQAQEIRAHAVFAAVELGEAAPAGLDGSRDRIVTQFEAIAAIMAGAAEQLEEAEGEGALANRQAQAAGNLALRVQVLVVALQGVPGAAGEHIDRLNGCGLFRTEGEAG